MKQSEYEEHLCLQAMPRLSRVKLSSGFTLMRMKWPWENETYRFWTESLRANLQINLRVFRACAGRCCEAAGKVW